MSDITREKALEIRKLHTNTGLTWAEVIPCTDSELRAFANAVRADFARELLGMDVEPVAYMAEFINREGEHDVYVTTHKDLAAATDSDNNPTPLLTTTQAAAMRLQEREKCAKVCESLWGIDGQFTADEFAAAIRNRKD